MENDVITTDQALQLFHAGKVEECIGCVEQVIANDPENALAFTILGAAYTKQGNKTEAINAFGQALVYDRSARSHFNLGKALEEAGRPSDAEKQYQFAVQIDPEYRQATEAINRLLHAAPVAAGGTLLGDPEDEETQTTSIPKFVPPSKPVGAPDLSDLETRAKQNEKKAQDAQKAMTKSGLIYGAIVGPIGLMGAMFLLRVFSLGGLNLPFVLLMGVLLGAGVGLWVGLTCGDDITGLKAGSVLGGIFMAIPQLFHFGEAGIEGVLISAVMGAVLGALSGYFIGMVVENSIGE